MLSGSHDTSYGRIEAKGKKAQSVEEPQSNDDTIGYWGLQVELPSRRWLKQACENFEGTSNSTAEQKS